jgi:D-alanyl-D-alanine carboxypeptidase
VNPAVRRPFLALAIAAVVIGGWLGAPLLAAPGAAGQDPGPDQAAVGSGLRPTPGTSPGTRPGTPSTATPRPSGPAPTPRGTLLPGGPPIMPVGVHRGSASATPLLRSALDARLEVLRAKAGIPGISATIIFADGSTWQGAAGLADVAAHRPVTVDTAFPVASVSKTFTSALILDLAADGKLGLDTTARTYLPGLAIDPAITVRELLDHTSGLRDFYFGPGVDKALLAHPTAVWDAARSLTYVGKPYAKPGLSWHYSNTNYLILGLIAEAVGGAPVADQLRDRFFTPLGLDGTWYQSVEAPRGPVAHGYRFTGAKPGLPAIDLSDGTRVVPFTSVVTAAGAAGSIASTSRDLARWAAALYGGSALPPDSRAALIGDALRTAVLKPRIPYGLGVQEVTIDGHSTLGHSGRFLGARAAIRYLTDDHISIAIVTNQSRSDPGVILADLLRLALQPQPDCITCPALP